MQDVAAQHRNAFLTFLLPLPQCCAKSDIYYRWLFQSNIYDTFSAHFFTVTPQIKFIRHSASYTVYLLYSFCIISVQQINHLALEV